MQNIIPAWREFQGKKFQETNRRLQYRTVLGSGGVWDGTGHGRSDCLNKFVEAEEEELEEAVLP